MPGFSTPEAAALAAWSESPGARARVAATQIIGDRAEVVVEVGDDPAHREYAYVVLRDGRWHESVSGSGPTDRWWDPAHLDWG